MQNMPRIDSTDGHEGNFETYLSASNTAMSATENLLFGIGAQLDD